MSHSRYIELLRFASDNEEDGFEVRCDSFKNSKTGKRSHTEIAFPTESNCRRKRKPFTPNVIPYQDTVQTNFDLDNTISKYRTLEDGPFPEEVLTSIHRFHLKKTFVAFDHLGGTYRPHRKDFYGKRLTDFQLTKEQVENQKPKKEEKSVRKRREKSPFAKVCKKLKLTVDSSNLAKQAIITKYFPKIKLPDDFVYIMSNERKTTKQSDKKHQDHCHCTNGCIPKYCINYLSQIECPTDCNCGDNCQNRVFTKMAYPELICFQSDTKGIGVKCNQDVIKKGTFITEYVGEVISVDKFETRTKRSYKKSLHHYCMNMNENEIIDATWMGNIARFINHSCAPNARTQTWDVNGQNRVGIFAIKDIVKGEEITYNYNFLIYNDETKQQECKCGAPNCQGVIGTRIVDEDEDSDSSSGLVAMLSGSEDEEYDSDDIYLQYISD
ncbi:predicted protein [Naegleria gruberi]|uniref:Predicted protein n=1 Tax=Naegleria gruberi TaxID=5762 RepID=D2VKE4_NAEGR|nr:uncharacterized protein NAEGRDRAFT_69364 [Naegleria gruberi]EFC42671.1 predicted protein [Naegleria gruberi]|eukprot:XP_002675415.1 predicted protein [Naegleria gruberi strain NEG-M]